MWGGEGTRCGSRYGIQGSENTGPLALCAYPFLFVGSLLFPIHCYSFPLGATEQALYF